MQKFQILPSLCTELFHYFTAKDAAQSLAILTNKNTPLIKKRQVMRSSFGDYRTKMAEEEKKLSKGWSLPPK
jgi:hypothetical protein